MSLYTIATLTINIILIQFLSKTENKILNLTSFRLHTSLSYFIKTPIQLLYVISAGIAEIQSPRMGRLYKQVSAIIHFVHPC